jgi:hypothetical protein
MAWGVIHTCIEELRPFKGLVRTLQEGKPLDMQLGPDGNGRLIGQAYDGPDPDVQDCVVVVSEAPL